MSDYPARPSKRSNLLRIFGTLLALILLVYLLSQQGWGEIWEAIHHIPAWRLILALMLMLISRLAVMGRWHVLLRAGGVPITFRQTLRINFAGLFSNNFLPTTIGGDVVRLAGVLQLKFDAAICTASLIVDRLVGMAGMAMAVPFGLPSLFQKELDLQQPSTTWHWIVSMTVIPASKDNRASKWLKKIGARGLELIRRIFSSLKLWLKQPRALAASLLFTGINMLCLFGVIQLLLGGMGDHLSIWLIGGLYSLVYFVTLIPISINGYGLQEVSMTLVFSSMGNASVSSGLTMALLFRTLMMLTSLPGAVFVSDVLAATKRKVE
jgi:glycosyltransferase 2 family protein